MVKCEHCVSDSTWLPTAFSYMMFLVFIIVYVAEVQRPAIYVIDCLTAVWILSYTFRDIGTGETFLLSSKVETLFEDCAFLLVFLAK